MTRLVYLLLLLSLTSCGMRLTSPPQEVTENRKQIASNIADMGEALLELSDIMVSTTPEGAAAKERFRQQAAILVEDTTSRLQKDEEFLQSASIFSSEEAMTNFTDRVVATINKLRGRKEE